MSSSGAQSRPRAGVDGKVATTAPGRTRPGPKADSLPLTGFATLGLLSPHERFTAVEVQERAYAHLRYFYWAPALSHIRRELSRLEELGYVNAHVVHKGRVKRTLTYSITDDGSRALAEWAERPEADALIIKNVVILRLWLGRRAKDKPAVLHVLDHHIDTVEAELESLIAHVAGAEDRYAQRLLALEEIPDGDVNNVEVLASRRAWHRAVMRYCQRNYEAELENARGLLSELQELAGAELESRVELDTARAE